MPNRLKWTPVNGVDVTRLRENKVEGLIVSPPTTASIKTANRVNYSAGYVRINGNLLEVVAGADVDCKGLHGVVVADETAKKFLCIAVEKAGVPVIYFIGGTSVPFLTSHALSVAPDVTDAEVEALFTDLDWVPIFQTKISRTGDTTMVQTYENGVRDGV